MSSEEARQLQELASLRDAKSAERKHDHEGLEREIQEANEGWIKALGNLTIQKNKPEFKTR